MLCKLVPSNAVLAIAGNASSDTFLFFFCGPVECSKITRWFQVPVWNGMYSPPLELERCMSNIYVVEGDVPAGFGSVLTVLEAPVEGDAPAGFGSVLPVLEAPLEAPLAFCSACAAYSRLTSGCRWIPVDVVGCRWMPVDASGCRWMPVDVVIHHP